MRVCLQASPRPGAPTAWWGRSNFFLREKGKTLVASSLQVYRSNMNGESILSPFERTVEASSGAVAILQVLASS